MSNLQPDCKLLSGIADWQPRKALALNSGISIKRAPRWPALWEDQFDCHKDIGTYVPKDDWRSPTDGEIESIIGVTDEDNFGATIQLFQIPEELHRFGMQRIKPHVSFAAGADSLGFFSIP